MRKPKLTQSDLFSRNDAAPEQVLTPTQLNRAARDILEAAIGSIWIIGEISNFIRHASGHCYFTLKDDNASIRCAMFKQTAMYSRCKPENGMQVLLRAKVSLYEQRGEFQLIVEKMQESGEGALQRQFEQLKLRLAAEGLFDIAHKKALPKIPSRLAVITSPTGAAVRDVISVLNRRFPALAVDVIPSAVQGEEAPSQLLKALQSVIKAQRHDVILLTRGGGSLEDLWAFNNESLARAIFASPIPVVSAVGHEVDFSICDFVADVRAATPSAAAELIAPSQLELLRYLSELRAVLSHRWQSRLNALQQSTDLLESRLRLHSPSSRLKLAHSRLHQLQQRLQYTRQIHQQKAESRLLAATRALFAQHPKAKLKQLRQQLTLSTQNLNTIIQQIVRGKRQQLASAGRALDAISPLATLNRGYAVLLTNDASRQVKRSIEEIQIGENLAAILKDGEVELLVKTKVSQSIEKLS